VIFKAPQKTPRAHKSLAAAAITAASSLSVVEFLPGYKNCNYTAQNGFSFVPMK
jgi:hypothetical protein